MKELKERAAFVFWALVLAGGIWAHYYWWEPAEHKRQLEAGIEADAIGNAINRAVREAIFGEDSN